MLKITLVVILVLVDKPPVTIRTPMASVEECATEVAKRAGEASRSLPEGAMLSAGCEVVKDPLL